jgi:hypothetical protein
MANAGLNMGAIFKPQAAWPDEGMARLKTDDQGVAEPGRFFSPGLRGREGEDVRGQSTASVHPLWFFRERLTCPDRFARGFETRLSSSQEARTRNLPVEESAEMVQADAARGGLCERHCALSRNATGSLKPINSDQQRRAFMKPTVFVAVVALMSFSPTAQAVHYEFHPNLGGYGCQLKSSHVVGGTLVDYFCNAAQLLIDKDTGVTYWCSAYLATRFLNGKFIGESSGSRDNEVPKASDKHIWLPYGLDLRASGRPFLSRPNSAYAFPAKFLLVHHGNTSGCVFASWGSTHWDISNHRFLGRNFL